MSNRETYAPGLVRELRHPPAMVWQALTDPAHLREWAKQFGVETPAWPSPSRS